MKSFVDIDATFAGQPARLGVLLQRVDVGLGREELFTDQLPELLSLLAEQTRVASIRASNAIEGIDVDPERAERLAGGARFRNRSEREFAGYRDAIDGLMRAAPEPISVPLLLHLHRQIFQHSDGHGGEFKHDDNAIVSYQSGRRELIFEPVSRDDTPFFTTELVERYVDAQRQGLAHPLVLLGAFILDLLAIHPVADGNGRLARLATTHELLQLGYGVARYVSIEQEIFETKNAYYASLAESQRGWHEGHHDIWPWVEYLLGTLPRPTSDLRAGSPQLAETKGRASSNGYGPTCWSRRRNASRSATSAGRYQESATKPSGWSSTSYGPRISSPKKESDAAPAGAGCRRRSGRPVRRQLAPRSHRIQDVRPSWSGNRKAHQRSDVRLPLMHLICMKLWDPP